MPKIGIINKATNAHQGENNHLLFHAGNRSRIQPTEMWKMGLMNFDLNKMASFKKLFSAWCTIVKIYSKSVHFFSFCCNMARIQVHFAVFLSAFWVHFRDIIWSFCPFLIQNQFNLSGLRPMRSCAKIARAIKAL